MQVLPKPSFGATGTVKSGDKAKSLVAADAKNAKELTKQKKGMSILYQTLEY